MEWMSLLVFGLLSLLGLYIKKIDSSEKKALQFKLFSYVLLTSVQLLIIHYKYYYIIALIIVIFSIYELQKLKINFKTILITLPLFALFIHFSKFEDQLSKFFILVILFDGYSQLFGQGFGKNKIAPTISPNKTWEGFLLGMTAVVLHSVIFYKEQPFHGLFIGILIGLLAFTGDLLASAVKRKYQVKDFSNLLVSHGGFLDRFDSLILTFVFMNVLQELMKISYLEVMTQYTLCFLMIFFLAEYFYHVLKFKVESSRKFVHISSGLIALSFPFMINELWIVIVLCSGFMLLLISSKKMGLLKSIHAIERESFGSLYYPISVIICFFSFKFSNNITFYLVPMLILTISDSLAALVGKRFPSYKLMNTDKTVFGTLTFFVSCFLILFFLLHISLLAILFITTIVTITEFYSKKGLDNLLIVCVTLLILFNL